MLYCLLHVQSHHVCDSAQSDGKATEQCTVVGKEAIAARNIYSKAMLSRLWFRVNLAHLQRLWCECCDSVDHALRSLELYVRLCPNYLGAWLQAEHRSSDFTNHFLLLKRALKIGQGRFCQGAPLSLVQDRALIMDLASAIGSHASSYRLGSRSSLQLCKGEATF